MNEKLRAVIFPGVSDLRVAEALLLLNQMRVTNYEHLVIQEYPRRRKAEEERTEQVLNGKESP